MAKFNIKKGDKVKVIAGNSRGKISTVLQVITDESKVLVEGVNVISKHQKPTSSTPNGSIVKKEAPINMSNVMIVDASSGLPTRVGRRKSAQGKTERYSIKSGQTI
jgi:large subunit ribosomal protein L24